MEKMPPMEELIEARSQGPGPSRDQPLSWFHKEPFILYRLRQIITTQDFLAPISWASSGVTGFLMTFIPGIASLTSGQPAARCLVLGLLWSVMGLQAPETSVSHT